MILFVNSLIYRIIYLAITSISGKYTKIFDSRKIQLHALRLVTERIDIQSNNRSVLGKNTTNARFTDKWISERIVSILSKQFQKSCVFFGIKSKNLIRILEKQKKDLPTHTQMLILR